MEHAALLNQLHVHVHVAKSKIQHIFRMDLLLAINPLVLKILKLAMLLRSYERFFTGKVE